MGDEEQVEAAMQALATERAQKVIDIDNVSVLRQAKLYVSILRQAKVYQVELVHEPRSRVGHL